MIFLDIFLFSVAKMQFSMIFCVFRFGLNFRDFFRIAENLPLNSTAHNITPLEFHTHNPCGRFKKHLTQG